MPSFLGPRSSSKKVAREDYIPDYSNSLSRLWESRRSSARIVDRSRPRGQSNVHLHDQLCNGDGHGLSWSGFRPVMSVSTMPMIIAFPRAVVELHQKSPGSESAISRLPLSALRQLDVPSPNCARQNRVIAISAERRRTQEMTEQIQVARKRLIDEQRRRWPVMGDQNCGCN